MAPSFSAAPNLQASAGDLARRLSSLRHFLHAASQLLTCEKFTSPEINRHCRKIVTLMEIAQTTLSGAGVKLYKFASCEPSLFPYKLAYFKLLRMLQRFRRCVHDRTLHGRINRLLLPLFTNLRTPASEDLAEFSQASPVDSRSTLGSRSPPQHTPSTPSPHAGAPSNSLQHATPPDYRTMPPPDELLCGRNHYRARSTTPRATAVAAVPLRSRSVSPPLSAHIDDDNTGEETDSDSDEDEADEPAPTYYRRSPRFGIYCTGQSSHSRSRNDHSTPLTAY